MNDPEFRSYSVLVTSKGHEVIVVGNIHGCVRLFYQGQIYSFILGIITVITDINDAVIKDLLFQVGIMTLDSMTVKFSVSCVYHRAMITPHILLLQDLMGNWFVQT